VQTDHKEQYRLKNVFYLSKHLKPYAARMFGAIVTGILNHIFTIGISCTCAYMVGLVLENKLDGRMNLLIILLLGLVLGKVVAYFGEMWLAHDVAFKVLSDFRIKLYDAIEKVSPALLLNKRLGQIASILMSDVELLEWFFAHSFGSVIVAFVVPAILLIFLGSFHIMLPLIMLLFIGILIWVPLSMKEKADQKGQEVRAELGEANSVIVEGVQGIKELLTLNYVDKYKKKNMKYMHKLYTSQLEYGKRLGTEGALLQVAVGIAMICVTAYSALLVFNGNLEFEWFTVVVMLSGIAFNPIIEICNTARNFGLIFAAANRVFLILNSEPVVKDCGKETDISQLKKEILFSDVSFRYKKELPLAVENISFSVNPGETVALVGASGAGKSTCIRLLLRQWDIESGSVKIGGMDIRDMTLGNLQDLISVVFQDVYLFHKSIRENIRLGKPGATDEEVEKAAKAALAHSFIIEMKNGYDTLAGEKGVQLSGGQRQRIAIARAILKGSSILIMDEAVSNLDTENERLIEEALKENCKDYTKLIVAHRLSTILSADKLIVFERGKIAQVGNHEKLIKEEGVYRNLVKAQFE